MIRRMGIVLFAVYVILLIYFLFFSEEYGRVAQAERVYRYNLVPFVEIRRFWVYREQLGSICRIYQYFRKCDRLPTFRVYPSGYFQKNEQWFSYLHIRIYIKSDSRSDPACHEGRMF